jgi:hypothetical protein
MKRVRCASTIGSRDSQRRATSKSQLARRATGHRLPFNALLGMSQHAIATISALGFALAVATALQEPLESTMKLMAPPLAASLVTTAGFVRAHASMPQPY